MVLILERGDRKTLNSILGTGRDKNEEGEIRMKAIRRAVKCEEKAWNTKKKLHKGSEERDTEEKEEKGKIGKEEKRAIEINRIKERAIKKWKEGSKPGESKGDN